MLTTPTESSYLWPIPADAKSVLHFYKHNAIQRAAHEVLSAALCETYFSCALFDATNGSSFMATPERLAIVVAERLHAAIVRAACFDDPALLENEKRELEILKGSNDVAA